MKNTLKYQLVLSFIAGLFVLQACIDPFSPPEVNSDQGYLVVDGFLNLSNEESQITLRKSQNVNDNTVPLQVTGAQLKIQSEKGEEYDFTETSNAVYTLPGMQFDINDRYRLDILTSEGKHYQSAFVNAIVTPAIDSISSKLDTRQNAMVFSVNTHDDTGKTRFYRWKFEDTYEYNAALLSSIMVQGDEIVARPDNIYTCWRSGNSTNIILGSTIKITKDEIRELPINTVYVSSQKLLIKYSMLVRQYGLTREAFEYWTELSKSTQGTGSLFDPQPSTVTGNIQNVDDPQELVFGYFGAVTEEKKRIFVSPRLGFPNTCQVDTIPIACGNPDIDCAFETQNLLLAYMDDDFVFSAAPSCADCRTQGGTNVRPSFWD
ncbi:uncharacterized protein DUF4249 [Dyadobacter jejuensis]|uniref:Uncharacterized protein DUF4249 n=1 Tax=Dyadobacter jejuensis TaxID=1082580 RepID=A0A316ASM3_9BACT|nr:DUF4249 domain-containing protein [Dyadobacter jejuensis]PWJ60264.1 uncharacterized protein DUF4249 [Dyadobacter jejuensis]